MPKKHKDFTRYTLIRRFLIFEHTLQTTKSTLLEAITTLVFLYFIATLYSSPHSSLFIFSMRNRGSKSLCVFVTRKTTKPNRLNRVPRLNVLRWIPHRLRVDNEDEWTLYAIYTNNFPHGYICSRNHTCLKYTVLYGHIQTARRRCCELTAIAQLLYETPNDFRIRNRKSRRVDVITRRLTSSNWEARRDRPCEPRDRDPS